MYCIFLKTYHKISNSLIITVTWSSYLLIAICFLPGLKFLSFNSNSPIEQLITDQLFLAGGASSCLSYLWALILTYLEANSVIKIDNNAEQ